MLDQALWWSDHRSPEQAFDWLMGFETALQSLAKTPQQHRLIREKAISTHELREIYYGLGKKATHRAIFEIRENDVIVYSVRHLAQADLTEEDL